MLFLTILLGKLVLLDLNKTLFGWADTTKWVCLFHLGNHNLESWLSWQVPKSYVSRSGVTMNLHSSTLDLSWFILLSSLHKWWLGFGMRAISEISAIVGVQNSGLVVWNQRKAWVQHVCSCALKSGLSMEPGQAWWLYAFDGDKKELEIMMGVWKGGDKGWRGGMRKGMPASAAAGFELCRNWSKAVSCQHKWRARKDLTDINMTAFFSCRSAKEQTQISTYIMLLLR